MMKGTNDMEDFICLSFVNERRRCEKICLEKGGRECELIARLGTDAREC